MIWALLEILVPLILALLLGLLIGWVLFRWRRRPLHAHEWNQLANNASDAERELGSVRAAYEEAKNERGVLSGRVAALANDLDAAQIAVGATTRSNEALTGEVDALQADVTSSAARIESLERELASANEELSAKSTEMSDATESDDAASEATELESALAAARTELDVSQGRIADLDTRLSTTSADLDAAHTRVSELEDEIGGARSQIAGFASLESEAGQLQIDLKLAKERVRDLEGQAATAAAYRTELDAAQGRLASRDAELAQARAELVASQQRRDGDDRAAITDSTRSDESDAVGVDWRSREPTTLGTAGARHVDDLRVIRGIGPRMQELLNSFGITSWEQLAELDESEVAAVDDALQGFPGRIERDAWVAQANGLVREFPDRTNRPTRKTYVNRTND